VALGLVGICILVGRPSATRPQVANLPHNCNCQEPIMPSSLELGLYVFMLATFVGLEVIRKVSPLLHTPLMSLTNAISAISVVGAILITGAAGATTFSKVLGFIAITAAVTNIVSGFLITDRMLKMFKKRVEKK
jgi:NAD(P) transhydrogenase subunit alpha